MSHPDGLLELVAILELADNAHGDGGSPLRAIKARLSDLDDEVVAAMGQILGARGSRDRIAQAIFRDWQKADSR